MSRVETISVPAARRIALAAQGFGTERTGRAGRRQLAATAARLGMFQIDSVNVLARAHTMPAFSRLGPYAMADFEQAAWGRRRLWFEYWGHEASLLPLETWPLLRWRMDAAARGEGVYGELARFAAERGPFIASVLAELRDRGALAAADLAEGGSARGKWWGWSDGKRAMEYLFWIGAVTVSHRRGAFERVYDLPARVLPAAILELPVPDPAAAQRALLRQAAAAMGIANEKDLRAYWRLKPDATARVQELVEAGELHEVAVEGWKQPGLLWHAAQRPPRVAAHSLLSPFDPILWERDRALRLFDFHYRIGLYTPKEKRTDGYYVLPFLMGERIAARVDLKADRAGLVLHVHAAHREGTGDPVAIATALAEELRTLASWLSLNRIAVARQGDLAAALHAAAKG